MANQEAPVMKAKYVISTERAQNLQDVSSITMQI